MSMHVGNIRKSISRWRVVWLACAVYSVYFIILRSSTVLYVSIYRTLARDLASQGTTFSQEVFLRPAAHHSACLVNVNRRPCTTAARHHFIWTQQDPHRSQHGWSWGESPKPCQPAIKWNVGSWIFTFVAEVIHSFLRCPHWSFTGFFGSGWKDRMASCTIDLGPCWFPYSNHPVLIWLYMMSSILSHTKFMLQARLGCFPCFECRRKLWNLNVHRVEKHCTFFLKKSNIIWKRERSTYELIAFCVFLGILVFFWPCFYQPSRKVLVSVDPLEDNFHGYGLPSFTSHLWAESDNFEVHPGDFPRFFFSKTSLCYFGMDFSLGVFEMIWNWSILKHWIGLVLNDTLKDWAARTWWWHEILFQQFHFWELSFMSTMRPSLLIAFCSRHFSSNGRRMDLAFWCLFPTLIRWSIYTPWVLLSVHVA